MAGGGGGGTSTSIQIPMEGPIRSFIEQTIPGLQAAQSRAPLAQFLDPQVRQIAGLAPLETQGLASLGQGVDVARRRVGLQTPEQTALEQLAALTGGSIGSSPVTQAGLRAFEDIQAPAIQNTLNAMGMGRSGAGAEQLALARTAALTPLLQQEMQTRAAAVPQYLGLGGTMGGRETEGISRELQALTQFGAGQAALGGQERQVAQTALDAPLQDYLRRQAIAQGVTTLGGTPFTAPTQTTTTTPRTGFLGK